MNALNTKIIMYLDLTYVYIYLFLRQVFSDGGVLIKKN